MTQKQKSRYAFIRAAKKDYGLTQGQSNALYSKWSAKYGGLVSAVDLKRHPVVAKRLAEQTKGMRGIRRSSKEKLTESSSVSGLRAGETARGKGASRGGTSGRERPSIRSVKTLQEWNDYYDDYEYEPVEYESSADYGEV